MLHHPISHLVRSSCSYSKLSLCYPINAKRHCISICLLRVGFKLPTFQTGSFDSTDLISVSGDPQKGVVQCSSVKFKAAKNGSELSEQVRAIYVRYIHIYTLHAHTGGVSYMYSAPPVRIASPRILHAIHATLFLQ